MKKIVILFVSFISASILSQQGNVGVNTTTPQKTLHVNGSLQLTNELNLGGDDKTAGDAGNAGQVLTSQGSNKTPSWTSIPIPSVGDYYLKEVYQMDVGKGVATKPRTNVLLATLNDIEVTSKDNFLYVMTQNNAYLEPNTQTGISFGFNFLLDGSQIENTSIKTIYRQGFIDATLDEPYIFIVKNVAIGKHRISVRGYRSNNVNNNVTAVLYFNTAGSNLNLKKGYIVVFVYEKYK